MTRPTDTEQTSTTASTPGTGEVPSMRDAFGRHALAEAVDLVTSPEAGQDTGPERVTRDPEAFQRLAEDMRVRRVLWMLASGFTWPWLLDDVTTPAARNRAIRRGLVAPPVGEPGAELVPYHLTDAGRAELLAWVEAITPHKHLPDVVALWRAVTFR